MIPINAVDKFERYENIKIQIKGLEKELEELKVDLVPLVPEGGLLTNMGKFSISSKPKWVYSQALQTEEKKLKEAKKFEEQTGTATMEPGKPFILYKENGTNHDDA